MSTGGGGGAEGGIIQPWLYDVHVHVHVAAVVKMNVITNRFFILTAPREGRGAPGRLGD